MNVKSSKSGTKKNRLRFWCRVANFHAEEHKKWSRPIQLIKKEIFSKNFNY